MNKRSEFIYELIGQIHHRKLIVASPPSKYAGQEYYKLIINQENQLKKRIQAWPDKLTNPTIWKTIEQKEYSAKKYLFKCLNFRGFYYLVDWEELPEIEEAPEAEGEE